jgi:hypothetical protein
VALAFASLIPLGLQEQQCGPAVVTMRPGRYV